MTEHKHIGTKYLKQKNLSTNNIPNEGKRKPPVNKINIFEGIIHPLKDMTLSIFDSIGN